MVYIEGCVFVEEMVRVERLFLSSRAWLIRVEREASELPCRVLTRQRQRNKQPANDNCSKYRQPQYARRGGVGKKKKKKTRRKIGKETERKGCGWLRCGCRTKLYRQSLAPISAPGQAGMTPMKVPRYLFQGPDYLIPIVPSDNGTGSAELFIKAYGANLGFYSALHSNILGIPRINTSYNTVEVA